MRPDPGGLAYGMVTVGGVLAAESALRDTYAGTLAGAVAALALYWLAHSYAGFTRRRADGGDSLGLAELVGIVRDELSILAGAAIPVLVLAGCRVFGASLATGVDAATWTAAGLVVALEVGLGFRDHLPPRELALQSALGLTLGLLVIAIRALLH